MTREELQRLYSECVSRAFRAEQLAGLVRGVESFLAEPDPTVEIAYLKAKLADVEAERDQLKKRASDLLWQVTPGSDGQMSAAEMAEAMYPESDITYGYQAVREAYEYGYAAAENRVPGMLSMKWDGGRCAVLDADQRIVGYLPPGRQAEAGRDQGARVKELRGAAEAYLATHLHGNSAWINREHVAQWLHDRADTIESGANHA